MFTVHYSTLKVNMICIGTKHCEKMTYTSISALNKLFVYVNKFENFLKDDLLQRTCKALDKGF